MASDRVEVVISARDEFTKNFNSLAVKAGTISGVVSASLTKAFELSGDALRGLVSITGQAIKAANEQEDAEKRLTVALGYRSKALIDQATALQKVTIYEDNQIIEAQAAIAMYVKDEAQIKAVTKATLDMATAKGMDLHSASQLVARTLGSETNALARQGIEVKGAVGSTERLNSLINELSNRFSGQAAAAAETFSGKTAQAKNALGELYETIGGVITRNTFFIKGLDLVKQYLERAATWVDNNRLMLMNLTKDGIVNLMVGIGKAIEVMRFFHNGWLGLKIIGNAVAIVFADSLKIIFEGLRLILLPLDLIYKGMVKLGVIASNPFDKASEAIGQFQLSSRDVMAEVLRDTEEVNHRYDEAGFLIDGMTAKLRDLKVEQIKNAETARIKPLVVTEDNEASEALKKKLLAEGLRSGQEAQMWDERDRDATSKAMQEMQRITDISEAMKFAAEQNWTIKEEEAGKIVAANLKAQWSEEARARVSQLAYRAMENQMLSFIETGKFSVGAFAKQMAQDVKIELAGLAAKATVRALYETGLGFATWWSNPAESAAHFTAATTLAGVAAASAGAAMAVNTATGGGAQREAPGTPGGLPIETMPRGEETREQDGKTPQNITIQVYALDPSSVNWDRITEQEIVPALNRAGDRNVQLQVNVVGA